MSYYIDKNGNKVVSDKNAVKGQYSFTFEGTKLAYNPPLSEEEEKEHIKRGRVVAYYDAYIEMLEKYGKFNQYYSLWLALDVEFPSADAKRALELFYNNDLEELEGKLAGSRRSLKRSIGYLNASIRELLLQTPDLRYDEAYRDRERREKFRSYLRSERNKYALGKTKDIYTPEDLEARFQHWRATRKPRKTRRRINDQ
ncbi:hypothetical protein IKF94_03690 [Candidatus Saccharibacteria bacterium]|nr:hypothetical protein [Candidatus Saccharibacteria bacterium]